MLDIKPSNNSFIPAKVGVIIPTLGRNNKSLEFAVSSATKNLCVDLVLLITPSSNQKAFHKMSFDDKVRIIFDDSPGFASAMNLGVSILKKDGYKFFSGIGDDDEFADGFLDRILDLVQLKNAIVGLGCCCYINEENHVIFKNRNNLVFLKILHLTPNLIAAPGALIRIDAWEKVNGLNPNYKYVADFDLWLKLRKIGKFVRIRDNMSFFRWHDEGLTAGNRFLSRKEALNAQLLHVPRWQKFLFFSLTQILYILGDSLMKLSMKDSYRPVKKML